MKYRDSVPKMVAQTSTKTSRENIRHLLAFPAFTPFEAALCSCRTRSTSAPTISSSASARSPATGTVHLPLFASGDTRNRPAPSSGSSITLGAGTGGCHDGAVDAEEPAVNSVP